MPEKDKGVPVDVYSYAKPPQRKATEYLDAYKSWVYPAVRLIAQDTSIVELKLFRHTGDDSIEEVVEHDALTALRVGNEYQTEQQIRMASMAYYKLMGEFAWLILRSGKRIVGIYVLRPDWIKVKPNGEGGVAYYEYSPGGTSKTVKIQTENLIMHKSFNPRNNYRGFSPIRAMALDIDIDEYSDEWNRNFFFNSAMPSMIISTDSEVDHKAAKRFAEKFQSEHGGTRKSHKMAFMPGGKLNVDMVTTSMQELDFQASKKRLRDKILSAFGVSKSNLGLTEDVNRANALAQERRYKKLVVKPDMISFVGFLNEKYLPLWEDSEDLFFNFENPVPEDREFKLKLYKAASNQGWVSTNEVREDLLNLDPVEGGDTIYKPFNIQPIATVTEGIGNFVRGLFGDSDKKQSGVITMKTKAVGKDFDFGAPIRPRDTERAFIRKLNKELKHDIKNLIVTMLNQKQDGKKDTVTTGIKEETRVARWKTFMEHTNLYSQILKKIVQDLSKDQQKKVLQKLERRRVLIGDNKLDNAESIGFDLKAETSRWNNKIRPFIAKVIEERGNEELRELPLKAQNRLDMGREEVIDFLKNELGEKFVKEINQVTRDALIESIEAGLKAGEDYTELSNRVADIYGDLRGYRASRIGRTEVLRALNFGSMEAYRQSGVVEQKEWLATPDDRVRPSHAEADGQRVGLDEKFDVGGHKLNQPLDPNAPASETIHCRCTTIPITVYQQEIYDTIGEKTKEMKVEKVMNEVMQKIKEKKQQQKEIEQKVVDEQAKHISRASDKVKQKVWEEVYQEVKDSIKQRKQRLETKADEELMERESLVREEIRQAEKEIQKIKNKENHTRDELRRLEDIKLQQRAALNDELDNYKREQKKQTDKKVRQYRKKTIGQVKELQKKFDNKKKQVNQIDKKIKNKEKILDKAKQKANDIIEEAKNTAQKYRKGALDQFKILRDKVENVIKKDD